MNNFAKGHIRICHICGEKYFDLKDKNCGCWQCSNCGEEFSDLDMLGNRKLMLCLYCDNLKQEERRET